MKARSRKSHYFRTVAPAALTLMMWSGAACAQVRDFDSPSQDASQSIAEFAKQAGIEIFAPSEKLRGVQLPAVQGKHDVREALGILLAGSNLTIASDDGTLVTLRNKPAQGPGGFIKVAAATTASTAPQAMPAQSATSASVEEIVVTGSRVVRDGYEAPTPVSVISGEEIERAAKITSDGLLGGVHVAISPGGAADMLKAGGEIENTQGAVDIFGLIGQVLRPSGGAPTAAGAGADAGAK